MRDALPTPAKLTSWLRASGALPRGEIIHVHADLQHTTVISKLVFLTATYTPDAPADLPYRLVVKSPRMQPSNQEHGRAELRFFRDVAPYLPCPPVVRCLAAVEDEEGKSGTLVLEDLRTTHDHPAWPIPPARSEAESAIDALARVHRPFWEAPALGDTIGELHTVESLTSMVQGIGEFLSPFMDAYGDALTAGARRVYERVFASSLKPWLRLVDPRALTVIHGDAHAWNFLFPGSGAGPAYLIDWQTWHVDVGARDLAFMMALHWYPERRRELERPLLRRYHEALVASGIAGYTFDDLWLDYRRCVVRNLTIPLIFWKRGLKPEGWWHRLECAQAAYRELECDELL